MSNEEIKISDLIIADLDQEKSDILCNVFETLKVPLLFTHPIENDADCNYTINCCKECLTKIIGNNFLTH